MPVLLSQAHIKRVVARGLEPDAARQMQPPVRVVVRKAKDADATTDAAGLEPQILKADVGDRDLAFDEGRVDPQRTRPRVGQPSVEPAETAGRQRRPSQRRPGRSASGSCRGSTD